MPYQLNAAPHPKMLTRAPLMVIYENKFSTLCYISMPNGLQNKIFLLQKQFWQNQVRNQVLRFGGHKKDLGVTAPECPAVSAGLGRTAARVFHWGHSYLLKGVRHSENLFLIHNMNSNCRLCKVIMNVFPQIRIIGS